ncbi:MAG: aldo/keto reductase [Clostridiales bacterium]|nr:aldo/keto reductase [Clostridiales bacterium]
MKLGFGCMRLPVKEDGSIDKKRTFDLFDKAIQNGVTYFDTGYDYHNGESEVVLGEYIKNYDSGIDIATKLPVWLIHKREDMMDYFNKQLKKISVNSFDYYILHALDKAYWDELKALGVIEFMDHLKQQGLIKQMGFSFHDSYEVFEELVNDYNWDFCQVQFNIIDEDYQAGLKGIHLAKSKGLKVIVMEPLRGGGLVEVVPGEIEMLYGDRRPVEWAFNYILDQPVDLILSGMSDMEQLEENLKIFSNTYEMTEADKEIIVKVRAAYKSRVVSGCTGCGYCYPCPTGINIPKCLRLYDQGTMFDNRIKYKNEYEMMEKFKRAHNCMACGRCEKRCPQKIEIIEMLKQVNQYFKD